MIWTGKEDGISAAQPTLGPEALGLQDRQRGRRRAGLGGPGGPGGPRRPRRAPEGPDGTIPPDRKWPGGGGLALPAKMCAEGSGGRSVRAFPPPFLQRKNNPNQRKIDRNQFSQGCGTQQSVPRGAGQDGSWKCLRGRHDSPLVQGRGQQDQEDHEKPKTGPTIRKFYLNRGQRTGGELRIPLQWRTPARTRDPKEPCL